VSLFSRAPRGWSLKRALAVLLFALGASACGSLAQGSPSSEPVQLLTGDAGGATQWHENGVRSCFLLNIRGELVVDARYGTAIVSSQAGVTPMPVMWPLGFTGRRVGSEVEVLDPTGTSVATTGRTYRLDGGFWGEGFSACGAVQE
jgi:hypothetical protein